MQVHIDPDVCQGHTLCALAAPQIFLLREEDGHAYVTSPDVPPGPGGRRAQGRCHVSRRSHQHHRVAGIGQTQWRVNRRLAFS